MWFHHIFLDSEFQEFSNDLANLYNKISIRWLDWVCKDYFSPCCTPDVFPGTILDHPRSHRKLKMTTHKLYSIDNNINLFYHRWNAKTPFQYSKVTWTKHQKKINFRFFRIVRCWDDVTRMYTMNLIYKYNSVV